MGAIRYGENWSRMLLGLVPTAAQRYRPIIDTLALVNGLSAVFVLIVDLLQTEFPNGLPKPADVPPPPNSYVPAENFSYLNIVLSIVAVIAPRLTFVLYLTKVTSNQLCRFRCCVPAEEDVDGIELRRFRQLTDLVDVQAGRFSSARMVNVRLRRRFLTVDYTLETPRMTEFLSGCPASTGALALGKTDGLGGGASSSSLLASSMPLAALNADTGAVGGTVARGVVTAESHKLMLNVHEATHPVIVARVLRMLQWAERRNRAATMSHLHLAPRLGYESWVMGGVGVGGGGGGGAAINVGGMDGGVGGGAGAVPASNVPLNVGAGVM